ncbi:magnesium transporter NIPA-domain-containing protein [Radiomyces spectabilis]|uniref:magnesium transporter NIPA-domain-containing protein n=1 Tax=Radiomyces spectabilis TaxID=64574 RepID=UPI00221F6469|nr:magnesium transporter NIPA-domain-containing protein [Radiomyces spectabilis]KAI8370513.1 magnesium transporter NIPA-domain-containing protein [Radiomyces spectabilis]
MILDIDAVFARKDLLIGISLSIGGNILISVALNVQKLAHNRISQQQYRTRLASVEAGSRAAASKYDGFTNSPNAENKELEVPQYLRSKIWWFGFSLMAIGELGNFIAYGFAPASTIAPLGTTTLISNAILAPILLYEPFRGRDVLGIMFAVMGAAGVIFSSRNKDIPLSPELVVEALTQASSVIFYCITCILICLLSVRSSRKADRNIFVDLGLVAVYGAYTVLATKALSSMLNLTLYKLFMYPVSYILITVVLVTALMQIKFLNRALQHFDSTSVVPTQFVLFTLSAIVGSAIIYHDFDGYDLNELLRFMISCILEFYGVYLVTTKRQQHHPTQQEQIPDWFSSQEANDSKQNNLDQSTENHFDEASSLLAPVTIRAAPMGLSRHSSHSVMQGNERPLSRRRSSLFYGISLHSQLASMTENEGANNSFPL